MRFLPAALCTLVALGATVPATAAARSPRSATTNQYGGAIYAGAPDIVTTGAFITAGGGAKTFSTRTALDTVLGPQVVDPEIENLQKQYGAANVSLWLQTFDFVFRDAAAQAGAAGIQLPLSSPTHTGQALFTDLMTDGIDSSGAFYSTTMLDKLFTHAIHVQVMRDIEGTIGANADATYHKITNQFVYDVAVQLGLGDQVKLSPDH